jgi:hypothetical protein
MVEQSIAILSFDFNIHAHLLYMSQVFKASKRTGYWGIAKAAAEIAMFWDDVVGRCFAVGLLDSAGVKSGARTFGS